MQTISVQEINPITFIRQAYLHMVEGWFIDPTIQGYAQSGFINSVTMFRNSDRMYDVSVLAPTPVQIDEDTIQIAHWDLMLILCGLQHAVDQEYELVETTVSADYLKTLTLRRAGEVIIDLGGDEGPAEASAETAKATVAEEQPAEEPVVQKPRRGRKPKAEKAAETAEA